MRSFYEIQPESEDTVNVRIEYDKESRKDLKIEDTKKLRIIHFTKDEKGQMIHPQADNWFDYPRDHVFEVQGCGFACLLMRVEVLEAMGIYGVPFFPVGGLGEDLTFCWRAKKLDIRFHCDSRLKIGHIMRVSVDERFRDQLFTG